VSELTKDMVEKQRTTNLQCKRGNKYIPASVKHFKFIFLCIGKHLLQGKIILSIEGVEETLHHLDANLQQFYI
jgi:hypothetical protein